ncbi:diacylglycerol kinase family protein [Granulicatella elegans]|uniref:diacylglycerol kinase family protein n=1 Tax=Granulicatella elegans TaxID=137732 RepID=UPI00061D7661|nr:diacylglycerol kinase family protein [Granulicatella elegans]UEA31047.1 diacylglycerol kinase family protein [Granulicatella elegans]
MHKQVGKNHHFKQSLQHAINGIQTVFQDERNFRFDVAAAILVVILGVLLKIERLEWYWIIFCIFLMFILEMLNTVVEQLVDLMVEHNYYLAAKKAKDVAAGVVLMGSIFVLLMASVIFIPKILQIFL